MFLDSACSCLCTIHWTQVFSREWRCSWNSADRWCSNYSWVINNFIAYWSASYIRDLTVLANAMPLYTHCYSCHCHPPWFHSFWPSYSGWNKRRVGMDGKPSINHVNTLRLRKKMATIFQMTFLNIIFFNENCCILMKISLKFVPPGSINNIPPLVQIMAWRWSGNKPLSEQMMA